MKRIRIATCKVLPEVDADEAPLAAALDAAGIQHELLAWDDPAVDWDAPIPTLLRSTWNYALDLDAFLAWIDRVARAASLWNPPDVVLSNVRKRYLLELKARGVAIVPTTLIETPMTGARVFGYDRVVIKPEVGAGSLGAKVFAADDREGQNAHIRELLQRSAVLFQPYLASVDDHGERSVIWIDGELSHEIRKSPRFAGDSESVTGPFPIADDERDLALAALAPYADRILYGRVDMARGPDGKPMVMELELVEPSLFFARQPGAADRFVAALAKRL